jgi:riboflavin biosynthesis pyrimidine reductase
MVASADGKAAVEGRTRPLSSDTDRAVFHNLRTQVDAVMAGARTAAQERYGRVIKTDELRAKREREGLAADALAVIVSGGLTLPADVPLLQDRDSRVLILTHSDGELAGTAAWVEYLRSQTDPLDLRPLLERLRAGHGVRSILCEGGPTLNASLFLYGLVDELFLTVSPSVAGGADALTIVAGPPLPALTPLDLIWVLEDEGELFLRYKIGARTAAPVSLPG